MTECTCDQRVNVFTIETDWKGGQIHYTYPDNAQCWVNGVRVN